MGSGDGSEASAVNASAAGGIDSVSGAGRVFFSVERDGRAGTDWSAESKEKPNGPIGDSVGLLGFVIGLDAVAVSTVAAGVISA